MTLVGSQGRPGADGNDGPEQDRPAHHQRQSDPFQSIADESLGAPAMEAHVGEEAGDLEEGRHAKGVGGEEQHPERQAAMAVFDHPELHWGWQEREGRVEHDPQ